MNTIQHNLIVALSLCVTFAAPNIASAVAISGQGSWETTLQGRDLDGNLATAEAYYDTALNITWLADANYAMTSGYDSDGKMNWAAATAWAANLNPYSSGVTGWRLPTTIDADGPDADTFGNDGCNFTPSVYQGLDCGYNISVHSEMSHMSYVTLGLYATYSTSGALQGIHSNDGPFSNLQDVSAWWGYDVYWSATEYAPDTNVAWHFSFAKGYQNANYTKTGSSSLFYAWAVHSGDVGAWTDAPLIPTPVPAAAWLFGSGLLGLVGMSRKHRRC